MWKATAGVNVPVVSSNDDDWETDPDFVNDVTEEEQRWGSKTVDGSGRTVAAIDMSKLREDVIEKDERARLKQIDEAGPQASYGYGGKFGVQKDRMDKVAVGHDYVGKVEKHSSQTDHSSGFGGKFGVQTDRVDKSAVSWDHKETIEKHSSQKDYSTGFGGKFGVQSDRVDKSAVGWDHIEEVKKHDSQKDYVVGFGGKFGVQSDRQDKSAVGWDHHEEPQKHESQLDHKKGFGGKFGVQSDRVDKCAIGFDEPAEKVGTTYTKPKPDISGAKPSALRARFENMAKETEEETRKKIKEERERRLKMEKIEREVDASRKDTNTEVEKVPAPKPAQRAPIKTGSEVTVLNTVKQFSTPQETKQNILPPPSKVKMVEDDQQIAKQTFDTPDIIQNTQKANEKINESPEAEEIKEIISNDASKTTVQPTVVASPVGWTDGDDGQDNDDSDGYTAVALYDYQAAADDEISFDPDDVITNIEMIDEGWWRGLCKDQFGLFPANYVQLQQ